MKWKKLGCIFRPTGGVRWSVSHASQPFAEHLEKDRFRIYFSSRDRWKRSSIGFLEIRLGDPMRVLYLSPKPVVSPGSAGLFDDSGASMGCLLEVGRKRYLYYLGWNLGTTVPWRNFIGLALGGANGPRFKKSSPAPVLDRAAEDPYSLSYPFVMRENGVFRMWYGSNLGWGARKETMAHVIKYAESSDGIHWRRERKIAVSFRKGREFAVARPSVLRESGIYKMWFSARADFYRIGYAESSDGVRWERNDAKGGLGVSARGWDSRETAYPHVFLHEGRKWMLYNGNGYGKTGFGLAVCE